jgi:hypothetical protein
MGRRSVDLRIRNSSKAGIYFMLCIVKALIAIATLCYGKTGRDIE